MMKALLKIWWNNRITNPKTYNSLGFAPFHLHDTLVTRKAAHLFIYLENRSHSSL